MLRDSAFHGTVARGSGPCTTPRNTDLLRTTRVPALTLPHLLDSDRSLPASAALWSSKRSRTPGRGFYILNI